VHAILADEEAANDEGRTGRQRHAFSNSFCQLDSSRWRPVSTLEYLVKFPVLVCWCTFRNQDPNKQVAPWHVEVMEEVVFNSSPATVIVSA
jgi:hypothetical protein